MFADIPKAHPPLAVGGVTYSFAHLDSFVATLPEKGVNNADLIFEVVFSNHVYTERAYFGEPHDVLDHHGSKRRFDVDRYEMSKTLRTALTAKIAANELTHVSKRYSQIDNLILIETSDGDTWAIVYCLQPRDDISVRMEILSCHSKLVDTSSVARRNLSYFARMCLFGQKRVPNA